MEKISIRNAKYAKIGLQDLCDHVKNVIGKITREFLVVEIGSYVGDSSEIFANNFPQIMCIDPWLNGYDENDDSSSRYPMEIVEAQFDELVDKYKNIIKLKTTSREMTRHISNDAVELVYIDGIHTYDSVKEDIELWRPKVKKGFFIAGHDYKNKHHPGVAPAVDEMLGKPDQVFRDTSWIKRL